MRDAVDDFVDQWAAQRTDLDLRGWVKEANGVGQSTAGAPMPSGNGLESAERGELKRLRKLAADQAKTIEILENSDGLLREGERPVSDR